MTGSQWRRSRTNLVTTTTNTRKFIDYDKLRSDLSIAMSCEYPMYSDADTSYEFIEKNLIACKSSASTIECVPKRLNRMQHCPWIAKNRVLDIIAMIEEKRQLWKRHKWNRENVNIKNKFDRVSNSLRSARREAKTLYYEHRFASCKTSTQTWDEIRTVLNMKQKNNKCTELRMGGNSINRPLEIANAAAEHFGRQKAEATSNRATR